MYTKMKSGASIPELLVRETCEDGDRGLRLELGTLD